MPVPVRRGVDTSGRALRCVASASASPWEAPVVAVYASAANLKPITAPKTPQPATVQPRSEVPVLWAAHDLRRHTFSPRNLNTQVGILAVSAGRRLSHIWVCYDVVTAEDVNRHKHPPWPLKLVHRMQRHSDRKRNVLDYLRVRRDRSTNAGTRTRSRVLTKTGKWAIAQPRSQVPLPLSLPSPVEQGDDEALSSTSGVAQHPSPSFESPRRTF